MANTISIESIKSAAKCLNVSPAAIYAVCQVESAGNGFLASGKPKILFEGHIFWRQLKAAGKSEQNLIELAKYYPTILYPKWTRQYYCKDGEREYERLNAARAIHIDAANSSASWGSFQIMGMNYKLCGFTNVQDFVDAHCKDTDAHLNSLCKYLESVKLTIYLRNLNWVEFARRYNGPAYAVNHYDEKLERSYRNYPG